LDEFEQRKELDFKQREAEADMRCLCHCFERERVLGYLREGRERASREIHDVDIG
jgi:hypothetical protein